MWLTLNAPDVVHEVIDDELVLLNLRSGSYYSGNRTATALLESLLAHPDAGALFEAMESSAPASRVTIEEAVTYLVSEGLMQQSSPNGLPDGGSSPLGEDRVAQLLELLTAEPPLFEKFTDMRDILLLDPVHDVGDRGWPWQADA
jgi:hypothetical protein